MKSTTFAILVCLSAITLMSGCGRKKAPEPEPAPAKAVAPEVPADTTAPPPPEAAPVVVSTRESKDTAYNLEMAQTLNEFLGEYIKANKRIPKDINEMQSLKIITSIPPVTGGRKWVIDQRTGKISAQ